MASSSDAFFSKLRKWKNSKTVLKVTALTSGEESATHRGVIFSVDEVNLQVGFIESGSKRGRAFDVSGARFLVGIKSAEASRGDEDLLTFQEE